MSVAASTCRARHRRRDARGTPPRRDPIAAGRPGSRRYSARRSVRRAVTALHVPLAGEQPRHEAVEQPQRHAPEHVPLDLDALDLDRPLEVARRERQPPPLGRLAELLDGRGEQPRDLVRLEPPLDVGRDDARGTDRRGSPSPSSRADRARRAPRPATAGARPPPRPREAPSRGSCPRRPAPGGRPGGRAGRRGCRGRCGGAAGSAARRRRPERPAPARRRPAKLARRRHASLRSRSAAVSRRRISRASPPATSTAAGRVTPL